MWCAVWRPRIIGPIFFYLMWLLLKLTETIIKDFISLLDVLGRYCTFQQDGVTAHTAKETGIFT